MGVMKEYINKVTSGESLTFDDSKNACLNMLKGEATDSEVGALLASMRLKGESEAEIAGMASAIRDMSYKFKKIEGNIIDNCGTGGDRSNTFNISTTSSFVISGTGLKVAKHGNRSISSKSGSSNLLKELGVNINMDISNIEEILNSIGIVFLFAPMVHPLMKNIMKQRVDLEIPTIFNILGPLTNPIDLHSQFMGTYRSDLVEKSAKTLSILGRKRAVVINGFGGLDEASLEGDNKIAILKNGYIKLDIINGREFGFKKIKNSELIGGGPFENAKITLEVLKGKIGPHRDIVVFNSAIALFASGHARDIKEGIEMSIESIDSKAAISNLNKLIEITNK